MQRSFILFIAAFMLAFGCSKPNQPVQALTPKPAPALLVDFPTLSMGGLSFEQKSAFVQIVNEEACPCDLPQTFAACLAPQSSCKLAPVLAQWLIDRLKEGIPSSIMAEPLAKEINLGLNQNPQIVDVDGYAYKGSKKPRYTIVEFADFECFHCKDAAAALDTWLKNHSKDVKVVFKHFPLPSHTMAKQAAIAAEAAAEQGKFWPMHDALFANQQKLTDTLFLELAKKIGLNLSRFKKDLSNPRVLTRVENSIKEGTLLGIEGTPALFFNGRQYFLSLDAKGFDLRFELEKARGL